MASSGPGGQGVNKTQSKVRIVCIPLNLSAECQETRSQHQNKKIAFRRLAQKVKAYYIDLYRTEKLKASEVVRSYNQPDNRVKDHRSGHVQPFQEVMNDPSEMIQSRLETYGEDRKED